MMFDGKLAKLSLVVSALFVWQTLRYVVHFCETKINCKMRPHKPNAVNKYIRQQRETTRYYKCMNHRATIEQYTSCATSRCCCFYYSASCWACATHGFVRCVSYTQKIFCEYFDSLLEWKNVH